MPFTPLNTCMINHTSYFLKRLPVSLFIVAMTGLSSPHALAQNKAVVDFWNPDTGEDSVKALETTIASFESEHPNTKINLVNIPWGEIFTKWQTGIQSGDVPDVSIASATFSGSFQTQNALEPLDDVISELGGDSAFAPSARTLLSLCKIDNSYWAVPYTVNSVLLWYRKDLLAKAGIPVPKTWDELLNAAKQLTKNGVYGMLITSSKSYVTAQAFYSFMLSNGADIVDRQTGKTVIFDSPATVEAMKFYKELAKYSPPGASGYDRPQAQAAMTTGRIAMFVYGSWLGGPLYLAGPNVFETFAVAPVPTNKGKGAFMGNLDLVVFKNAKHKTEAKEFIKYLLKDENYSRYCLSDPSSYGPVTASVQNSENYRNSPKVQAVKSVIDAVQQELPYAWVYGMPNPHAGQIEGLNILPDVVGHVLLENQPAESAVKVGASRIQEIISQK
jgi:multiple sugar transport system substrate-binding protein